MRRVFKRHCRGRPEADRILKLLVNANINQLNKRNKKKRCRISKTKRKAKRL